MNDFTPLAFRRLRLFGWRQFARVEIEFHPRLTVITGANGSGKSTLLNILSRHLGAERPYYSVPRTNPKGGITYYVGRLVSLAALASWAAWFPRNVTPPQNQIGSLEYTNQAISDITTPTDVGAAYGITLSGQQRVDGVSFGSHRLLSAYHQVPSIPFAGVPPEEAYARFHNHIHNRYLGQHQQNTSLIFELKQTLAAWAAIGEGNSTLQADNRQKLAFDGFVEILRKVLPDTLGFIGISIRPPDVVLSTKSGDFLIDAASGGITTIIETAAVIYAYSLRNDVDKEKFVVAIDEPENHLHPSLQRSLFQNLTDAFPGVQFIVATHSPFIVSSLKEANVYVLRYEPIEDEESQSQRVVSQKLDYVNRAGNASEILREVLGLESTLPAWVEKNLQNIVARYQTTEVNADTLERLKTDLKEAGISELFPAALTGLSKQ